MKSSIFFTALIGLFALSFTNPVNEITKLNVDTAKSQVNWKGYKVLGSHEGTIVIKDGNLDFDGDQLTGGSFTIDMTTINCTDLEGEYKGKLEGHLKSDDFFGVSNFPTANFTITKVASRGKAGEYKVVGNLTIKGITKEIKFNAVISEKDGQTIATAPIKIDRSEFNVKYGSGSFFDNLGDNTIYDEFDLNVNLVVNK